MSLKDVEASPIITYQVLLNGNSTQTNHNQNPTSVSQERLPVTIKSKQRSDVPSYLAPTYAVLQGKNHKFEVAKDKPRFAFGKSKEKIPAFTNWSSKPSEKETAEKTPKGKFKL